MTLYKESYVSKSMFHKIHPDSIFFWVRYVLAWRTVLHLWLLNKKVWLEQYFDNFDSKGFRLSSINACFYRFSSLSKILLRDLMFHHVCRIIALDSFAFNLASSMSSFRSHFFCVYSSLITTYLAVFIQLFKIIIILLLFDRY